MKEIECDVIRDLLPNYCDKISSEVTNKLVEEHLKTCFECNKALENMNKELDKEVFENQEEIDYLKGYRKNKIKNIIFAVALTINIILIGFISYIYYIVNTDFYVDVNDIEVAWRYLKVDGIEDKTKFLFFLYSPDYYLSYDLTEDGVEGITYLDVVGSKVNKGRKKLTGAGTSTYKNANKIYLRDKKGNLKEIWNSEDYEINPEEIYNTMFYCR